MKDREERPRGMEMSDALSHPDVVPSPRVGSDIASLPQYSCIQRVSRICGQ
jgi:hypothetical protein